MTTILQAVSETGFIGFAAIFGIGLYLIYMAAVITYAITRD